MKYFRFLLNKEFWVITILIIVATLASRTLLFQSGYFNMHDDLQMVRQLQLEKCLFDLQIPCRWVPDMGGGYGFPLFNFYPPLPYFIGEIFRLFGASFVSTAKLLFAASLILSGIFMYYFSKEFFGRFGGMLSSVFYVWAPYRAVDVFVRGALNESWAFVWFPLILLFSYKLINSIKSDSYKWTILLALSYSSLLLTHNLMILIFTPVLAVWVILHLWRSNNWIILPNLFASGLISLGLASFFTIPALVENKFTHISSALEGFFEYSAHFVNINQLFITRFWGYGGSAWGIENDGMSFSVGHIHWIIAAVISFGVFIYIILNSSKLVSKMKFSKTIIPTVFFIVTGWFSLFMAHSKSTPIWVSIPQIQYVQFPWRFLTLSTLSFSFLVGVIPFSVNKFKKKLGLITKLISFNLNIFILFVLSFLLIVSNWKYFLPQGGKMGPLTDQEKFSGVAWDLQRFGGIMDYLPKTVEQAPRTPPKALMELQEESKILFTKQGTNWARAEVDIKNDIESVILNIFYYPGWKVFVDGREADITIPDEEKFGRMWVDVDEGAHIIEAEFTNTPVRIISNYISLISWVILIVHVFWRVQLTKREQ